MAPSPPDCDLYSIRVKLLSRSRTQAKERCSTLTARCSHHYPSTRCKGGSLSESIRTPRPWSKVLLARERPTRLRHSCRTFLPKANASLFPHIRLSSFSNSGRYFLGTFALLPFELSGRVDLIWLSFRHQWILFHANQRSTIQLALTRKSIGIYMRLI